MSEQLNQDFKALATDFSGFKTELLGLLEKQSKEIEKHGKTTEETGAELRKAHQLWESKETELKAIVDEKDKLAGRLDKIEKRLARPDFRSGGPSSVKTPGELFVESEQFKEFKAQAGARVSRDAEIPLEAYDMVRAGFLPREVKAITSDSGGAALATPFYDPELVRQVARVLTLEALLPSVTIGKSATAYYNKYSSRKVLYTRLATAIAIGESTFYLESVAGLIPGSIVTIEAEEFTVDAAGVDYDANTITVTAVATANHVKYTDVTSTRFSYVPQAQLRPRGKLTYAQYQVTILTLGRWIPVSNEMLDDVPTIQSEINIDLMRAHSEEREDQLIYGKGSSYRQLEGFMELSGANTYLQSSGPAGDTKFHGIRRALTLLWKLHYRPNGILVSHNAKEEMDLLTGEDGHFIFAALLAAGGHQQVARVPLLASAAMDDLDFLCADFEMSSKLYRRQGMTIRVGEPDDFSIRGLKAIIGETREGIAHRREDAVVQGTFSS